MTNVTIKSAAVLFLVVFAGVFGALWLDRYLESKRPVMAVAPGTDLEPGTPFSFTEAARRVMPSVVSIDTAIRRETILGDSLLQSGSGSGVVVQADGFIVTNAHVVRNFDERMEAVPADVVKVRTSDGRGYDAKVVGIDPRSDLAVIKVDNANLTPATFVEAAGVQVGDWVVAVGNQLGFENSVSVGVVSSKNRWLDMENSTVLVGAIQTDATINRGNSGGALCNVAGEVVGINSSIATVDGVSAGVGFAIPSELVTRVVNDLIEFGYVRYAILGVELAPPRLSLSVPGNRRLIADLTDSSEPPSYGVVVDSVEEGLPAAEAGIRQLDVILEIDGQRMNSNSDFNRATMEKQPGDEVEIKLWSRGRTKTVNVTLASRAP